MNRLGPSCSRRWHSPATKAAPATAAPTLIGDTFTFQLLDDGLGFGTLTHMELIAAPAAVSTKATAPRVRAEHRVHLDGGSGVTVPGFPAYQTTGFGRTLAMSFPGSSKPAVEIVGGSLVLNDVVSVALGDQVVFTSTPATLFVDDLGVGANTTSLGTVGAALPSHVHRRHKCVQRSVAPACSNLVWPSWYP